MFNYHESFFVGKMLKKVMEKKIMVVFVFMMLVVGVYAGGSWDSFSGGGNLNSSVVSGGEINHSASKIKSSTPSSLGGKLRNESSRKRSSNFLQGSVGDESMKYTENFYIALGLGGFGLLIFIFLIYLLLRRPKDKWHSKKFRPKK